MSEGNAATTGGTSAPTSAGNPDELAARLAQVEKEKAELERANRGLKTDLLGERDKRQQLEQQVKQTPIPTGNVGGDPVAALLNTHVQKAVEPLQKEVAQLRMEQAFDFIAKQENMQAEDVPQSEVFQAVVDTAKKYGIRGATPKAEAEAAYRLYKRDKEEAERSRVAAEEARRKQINANSTTSSTTSTTSTSTGKTFTNKEIETMSLAQYSEIRPKIQSGEIKVVG